MYTCMLTVHINLKNETLIVCRYLFKCRINSSCRDALPHSLTSLSWTSSLYNLFSLIFICFHFFLFVCAKYETMFFLFGFLSAMTCTWQTRITCAYAFFLFHFYICDICPDRHKHTISFLSCLLVHTCVFLHVSVGLCATARGIGGRWEVRCNCLFKPWGSTSTTTTTPVCLSNSSLQPRRCQAQGSLGLAQTTNTHFLKLQLYTTSQSNTWLLSNQQQHTPTIFYLRAGDVSLRKYPPAWLLWTKCKQYQSVMFTDTTLTCWS